MKQKQMQRACVITCVSNPCNYRRRYDLAKKFIARMSARTDADLYVVELVYPNSTDCVTDHKNRRHIKIEYPGNHLMWMKENLLNIGVELLPLSWDKVIFCDSDIEFETIDVFTKALAALEHADVIQLHSHCNNLNGRDCVDEVFDGFCFSFVERGVLGHPGHNIGMTRRAYDQIGGLYQHSILGSGDNILFLSIIGQLRKIIDPGFSTGYKQHLLRFQDKCQGLTLGYVPGSINHYYHGSLKKRRYVERNEILVRHGFDPTKHLEIHKLLLVPMVTCPISLLSDIKEYFEQRNEDSECSVCSETGCDMHECAECRNETCVACAARVHKCPFCRSYSGFNQALVRQDYWRSSPLIIQQSHPHPMIEDSPPHPCFCAAL